MEQLKCSHCFTEVMEGKQQSERMLLVAGSSELCSSTRRAAPLRIGAVPALLLSEKPGALKAIKSPDLS